MGGRCPETHPGPHPQKCIKQKTDFLLKIASVSGASKQMLCTEDTNMCPTVRSELIRMRQATVGKNAHGWFKLVSFYRFR